MSHVAALQEIRNVLRAIGVEQQEEVKTEAPASELELSMSSGRMA
jgi:hypothetical protein